ncbi:uncharacterized protein LOC135467261 [Liolophura sinensis]|uniref:uncharacterized protein LOC135467261 n=1 Tax=Liolophura sinensis TaxID=3198878 RepID=UPI0031597C12
MAHMYDRVVSVITKPAQERTDMEVEQILPWFRKKSDLFRNLRPGVVKDIIKNCQFDSLEKDTVVIRQGDKGDRFYIILNGSVSIYINPTLSDADNDAVRKQAQEQLAQADHLAEEGGLEKKKLDLSKFGNYIGKIEAGKSFGELALINKDCVRNASIITDVSTDLLVVDRTLYNRSLHAYQAQEFAQRSQFTTQYPLFSNWQPRYKKQMAMSLRKDTIPYESTIVRQGDPVENIYFLLSGQAKILVDPLQHQSQFPGLYPIENIDQLEQEEARVSIRKESIKEKPKLPSKVSRTPSIIRKANKEKKLQRQLELCVIGAVEIIGDLEVIMELGTYTHTAVCTQEAEVLVLNMKNYERLVQKRNPKTIEAIREIVETKLDIRCSRFAERQIPLLRYLLYKLRCITHPKKVPQSVWDKPAVETSWKVANFHRGPIIDLYGPGTVFHMIRMRDKARRHARARARFLAGGVRNRTQNKREVEKAEVVKKIQTGEVGITIDNFSAESDYSDNTNLLYGRHYDKRQVTGDWEDSLEHTMSDLALSQLEEKIRTWHCGFDDVTKATKRTVKLHRYHPEENQKPKPGKKVFIRKRHSKCSNLNDSQSGPEEDDNLLGVPPISYHSRHSDTVTDTCNVSPLSDTDADSDGAEFGEVVSPIKSTRKLSRRKKQKDPRRKYTFEDYQALRETLRQKQRTFGLEVNRITRAATCLS